MPDDKPKSGEDKPWQGFTETITHQMPLVPVGPPARRSPSLVVVSGYALGTIYRLEIVPLSIGRDPTNVIVVEDVGVSRRHAVIERLGDRAVVRDLGSKNGTFVNDETVDEQILGDGDLVHVGHTTYKFLTGDNVEQSYYEEMYDVAVQDQLTELPNRRYFNEVLEREAARARRHERTLVLLLADIDHFKTINDTHGHLCGDMILREFASIVRKRVRTSEFFARFGGEEFAFVLPEASLDGARVFAEAIRRLVAEHTFLSGEQKVPVTVSIGGAQWSTGMKSTRELLALADERLYAAKRGGRNRCEVHP